MRWYLSGPMSGLPEMNYPAFNAEAARLRTAGLYVINPAEIDPALSGNWEAAMRENIKLLTDCQAIRLLPGWERSRGARLEYRIATELGFLVAFAEGAEAHACVGNAD